MDGIYLLILFIISFLFGYLAKKSNILRDAIDEDAFNQAAVQQNEKKPKLPFSLSRTQLAFWTVIITSSFFFLWIKDNFKVAVFDPVNLILLGISMGTTAVASIIDSSQQNNQRHQNQPSSGFILDIISDDQGVSIHRLQNVLWTVIMGIIYIQYVATHSTLPDNTVLNQQVLILMGISSGAYVTLKVQENNNPATNGGNPS